MVKTFNLFPSLAHLTLWWLCRLNLMVCESISRPSLCIVDDSCACCYFENVIVFHTLFWNFAFLLSKCTKDHSSMSESIDLSSFYCCTITQHGCSTTYPQFYYLWTFRLFSFTPTIQLNFCIPFSFSGLPWLSLGSACWLLELQWLGSFQTAGDVFPFTSRE